MILEFLGPHTAWVQAAALAVVILSRRSIRRRHVLRLAAIVVLAMLVFFALLLWALASRDATVPPALFQGVLQMLAAIVVGCGSAVGFSLILAMMRLVSLEDR